MNEVCKLKNLSHSMYNCILNMHITSFSLSDAVNTIKHWVEDNQSKYVCVANVHMCMECFDSLEYRSIINASDMSIPDGKPLQFCLNLLGNKHVQQIRGTDITLELCRQANIKGWTIGFYGGKKETLNDLIVNISSLYPGIKIACAISPPFRNINEEEDNSYINQINQANVKLLFIGLGCPKQEQWMAEHRDRLNCIMLGIGAAFDFISENKKQAPRWVQKIGLEWLFRLCMEPNRLWKRYLIQNPRFIYHFSKQFIRYKFIKKAR
jgi:N-acetylglucosaminyldiphosphoundecaprenol N-acetyl-beta-D-mannosaminyltransferase